MPFTDEDLQDPVSSIIKNKIDANVIFLKACAFTEKNGKQINDAIKDENGNCF